MTPYTFSCIIQNPRSLKIPNWFNVIDLDIIYTLFYAKVFTVAAKLKAVVV